MDAHNHLKRLGWKGSGYSLGRSNSGITKPILISHKTDFLGLGARQQKEKQADQWWLRAFDNALQAFGTDKQSALSIVQSVGINRAGLHAYFVKGQGLKSTFDTEVDSTSDITKATPDSSAAVPPTKTQTSAAPSLGLEPLTLGCSERGLTQMEKGNKRKSSGNEVDEPVKKKIKIVDGLDNPSSTPLNTKEKKKKRKKHTPSGDDSAQRQAVSKQEKEIGGGAYDRGSDGLRRKEKQLKEMVKADTANREAAAEGSIIHTTDNVHFNTHNRSGTEQAFATNMIADPDEGSLESPKLLWHPDMLGDRRVKDLSKEERKARREWMRERRALKHAAAGKKVMSTKERQKRRADKKMKQRGRLVAKILQGKSRKDATKDDLRAARKKAKWMQRELKKKKRNKVIHRDKAGGGLEGSMGRRD